MSLPDYNFSTPIYWTRENAPKESQTIFGNYPDPIFRNPIFLSGNTDIDINIGAGYERPNVWAMLLGKGINLGMQLGGLWLMTRGTKKKQPETQPQPLNDYQIYLQNIKSSLDIEPVTINVNPSGPVAPNPAPQGQGGKRHATFSNSNGTSHINISGYINDSEITYEKDKYGEDVKEHDEATKYPAQFKVHDTGYNDETNGNIYEFQLTGYKKDNEDNITLTYTLTDESKVKDSDGNLNPPATFVSYDVVVTKPWTTDAAGKYIIPLTSSTDIKGAAIPETQTAAVRENALAHITTKPTQPIAEN